MNSPFAVCVWRSAFSPEIYREAGDSSVGRAFAYLTKLCLLAAVVFTVQAQVGLLRIDRTFVQEKLWEKNLPEIRIAGGVVSSDAAQPFVFERQAFVFVLDTTGATTDLDPKYRQGVLLTKTEAVYRRSQLETRKYSLEKLQNMVLNQATIERWLRVLKTWAWLGIIVIFGAGYFIAYLLQVVCWSLLGIIANAVMGKSLPYRTIFNVGVLALTVPWTLDLLKGMMAWRHLIPSWVPLGLYAGYLLWGISVQQKKEQVLSSE